MSATPVTPAALRTQAERLLAAHALPDGDPTALAGLLGRCEQRRLATGEILFREGDKADEMFFLLEGRVRVLKKDHAGHEREIGTWFAPAVVGALALVDDSRRSASCAAGAPSVVAVLDRKNMHASVGALDDEGAHLRWLLLSSFTETLSNTTDHLRRLLSGQEDPSGHLDRLHALVQGAKHS